MHGLLRDIIYLSYGLLTTFTLNWNNTSFNWMALVYWGMACEARKGVPWYLLEWKFETLVKDNRLNVNISLGIQNYKTSFYNNFAEAGHNKGELSQWPDGVLVVQLGIASLRTTSIPLSVLNLVSDNVNQWFSLAHVFWYNYKRRLGNKLWSQI